MLTRSIATSLLLTVLAAFSCIGAQPEYLILRTEPAVAGPKKMHSRGTATGSVVVAQPYAYGWFGAQPRRHWTRHFGYYRNYTEWSSK